MEEIHSTPAKPRKVGGFALKWSTGAISITSAAVYLTYIQYFCTNVVKMDTVLVGILIMASKIFDGITDVLVGFIVDKTHSKLGKGRPYNLSIVAVWGFMIALFSMPDMSQTWKAVYVVTGFTLITSVFSTLFLGSESVYLRRSTDDAQARTKILAISGAVGSLFIISLSIALPILVGLAQDTVRGWSIITTCLGIPLIAIGLIRFFTIKEKPDTVEEEKIARDTTVRESVSMLFRNKYIFLIGVVLLINSLSNNLTVMNTYYFKDIVGNINLASAVSAVALLSPLVVAFFPGLSKRLGTTGLVRIGMMCGVLSTVVRLIGKTNIPLLIVGNLLFTLSLLPMQALLNVFVIDCMQYTQYQSGKRIDGVVASVTNFCGKIGIALASGIIGVVMGKAGYDGSLAQQSASALNSIIFLYAILPGVLSLLSLLILHFYKLEKQMPKIREAIGEPPQ